MQVTRKNFSSVLIKNYEDFFKSFSVAMIIINDLSHIQKNNKAELQTYRDINEFQNSL